MKKIPRQLDKTCVRQPTVALSEPCAWPWCDVGNQVPGFCVCHQGGGVGSDLWVMLEGLVPRGYLWWSDGSAPGALFGGCW